MGEGRSVTPKQELFIKEYLVDLNATQAAIRCGYSEKTAYSQGQRLLKDVEIGKAVQKAMDERAEKVGISAAKVLENIERIATLAEAKEEYGAALKGQELLGKHLKMFTDKVEHSGKFTLEELIAGSE